MGISIDFFARNTLFVVVLLLVSASLENPLRAEGGGGNGASVIVAYKRGATLQDITHIEEKYGLQFVKTLAAANARVYRVPPKTSLEQTLRDLGTEWAVRYAEVDQEVTVKEE
jgi:hypothetical protein